MWWPLSFVLVILTTTPATGKKTALCQNPSATGSFFSPQQVITTDAAMAWDVQSGDFNNDGFLDLVSASRNNNIAWYKNLHGTTFSEPNIISTKSIQARSVATAFINRDVWLDIVSASPGDNTIRWYKNGGPDVTDPGTRFSPEIIISASSKFVVKVIVCDFNGDTFPDVAAVTQKTDRGISWFRNDGNGAFSGPNNVTTQQKLKPVGICCLDANNDGTMDVSYCLKSQYYFTY